MAAENHQELDIDDLVHDHLPSLRGYLASLGVHIDLIDDVAQDVFLEVIRNFKKYDPERPFKSWMFGIARNLVKQEFKCNRLNRRLKNDVVTQSLANSELEDDPVTGLVKTEAVHALKQCMESLPEKITSMVRLRFFKGMKIESIAAHLAMKSPAIRMALMRARRSLRDCVESRLGGEQT